MNSIEVGILFNALSEVLYNQNKIMKHFGVIKTDWDDTLDTNRTEEIANECSSIANNHLRSV